MYALIGNFEVTKDAFVIMYEDIKFHQFLECLELRWSQTQRMCMVIETEDVLRVVQVISHFKKEGSFFVNTFKF